MNITLTPEQVAELEKDVVRLCQELIRIPSVNFGDGKGDERAIADFVVAELKDVGIECELIEPAPNRVNVVTRIKGSDSTRPGLVLHGHLDVVPANAADWDVDPFSGLIKDGCIWGRGAIDMKDMDAMILAIVRLWARIGYKPPRDIVLAFFADEEAGSIYGSRWIAKKRPELFAGCTEAISEVGGFSYTLDTGKRIYAVQSAEKGINWMKLTATGNAGHGSMINEKNAVTALTEAVTKIGRHKWPIRPTKTVKILFKKVAELTNVEYDENDLGKLLPKFGSMGSMIGATLQNIANPTMLEAGYKANVIPQSASAIIDGRFLPGYENELAETIKELVGPDIKVEVLTRDIALEVDFSGPLVDAMCAALKIEDPEGIPVPYLMSGGTDNKALSDLGIVGFGFSPIRFPADLEFMPLFHGINERVPVDGLKFGVRTLHHFLINC